MSVNNQNRSVSLKSRLRRYVAMAATLLATAAAPAMLVVLATQTGCFRGPSAVGQGHKYVSGNPDYDKFFSQLYDLQVEMGKAPGTEKDIRTKLASKLGIDADASASMLARKVKKEAEKIEKHGIGLKLTVASEDSDNPGTAKLDTSGGALSGDAKTFAEAVRSTVEQEAKLAIEMKKGHRLLDQLRAQGIGLKANVGTVFRMGGLSKKHEVRKNLDDADTMITLMTARADQVSDAANDTAKRLTDAIDTDHGQFSTPAPQPEAGAKEEGAKKEEKKEKKPHWHPPPHHRAAPSEGHKPAPKPKKASPPPSDFEP